MIDDGIMVALPCCFQTAKPATIKQTAVARPINDAEVQAFLKRQQIALQQKLPTQIIAGTQLQQVRAGSVRVLTLTLSPFLNVV